MTAEDKDKTVTTVVEPAEPKTRRKVTEVPFQEFEGDIAFTPQTSRKRGRERSAYQLNVDAKVQESYDTGKPKALIIPNDPDALADIEKRVRNSGNFLNVGIRTGEVRYSEDGTTALFTFKAVERIKKTRTVTRTSESE